MEACRKLHWRKQTDGLGELVSLRSNDVRLAESEELFVMKLKRFAGNPILSAHPGHDWEDLAVFNPGAWYDERSGEVLLLYRAAESHPEYKCYFGLAKSRDGYHFERVSDEPVLRPSEDGWDASTIQDPRIIRLDDWYYVTYAAPTTLLASFGLPPASGIGGRIPPPISLAIFAITRHSPAWR